MQKTPVEISYCCADRYLQFCYLTYDGSCQITFQYVECNRLMPLAIKPKMSGVTMFIACYVSLQADSIPLRCMVLTDLHVSSNIISAVKPGDHEGRGTSPFLAVQLLADQWFLNCVARTIL
jgi:hypothetical protein